MILILHRCPTCGAEENTSCRTPKGRKKENIHDTRPFSITTNPTAQTSPSVAPSDSSQTEDADGLAAVGPLIQRQRIKMTTTKIRYGINKAVRQPHKRTKILHETHAGRIELPFENENFLRRVLDLVQQKHPGWNLTGYFPVTTKGQK